MSECPEDLVCFTEDDWTDFVTEYELEIIDEVGRLPDVQPASDAQAVVDFGWQLLFLTPLFLCNRTT